MGFVVLNEPFSGVRWCSGVCPVQFFGVYWGRVSDAGEMYWTGFARYRGSQIPPFALRDAVARAAFFGSRFSVVSGRLCFFCFLTLFFAFLLCWPIDKRIHKQCVRLFLKSVIFLSN